MLIFIPYIYFTTFNKYFQGDFEKFFNFFVFFLEKYAKISNRAKNILFFIKFLS